MRSCMNHPPNATRTRWAVLGWLALASPEQILADPNTTWQPLTLEWYGQGERTLEICTGTALWYRAGCAPLPIRWVLTRGPQGKRPPQSTVFDEPNAGRRGDRAHM